MNEDGLGDLLRAAMPAVGDTPPARDVWPELVHRVDARTCCSFLDLGLAVAVVVVLLMFPEWLWLLAYHL